MKKDGSSPTSSICIVNENSSKLPGGSASGRIMGTISERQDMGLMRLEALLSPADVSPNAEKKDDSFSDQLSPVRTRRSHSIKCITLQSEKDAMASIPSLGTGRNMSFASAAAVFIEACEAAADEAARSEAAHSSVSSEGGDDLSDLLENESFDFFDDYYGESCEEKHTYDQEIEKLRIPHLGDDDDNRGGSGSVTTKQEGGASVEVEPPSSNINNLKWSKSHADNSVSTLTTKHCGHIRESDMNEGLSPQSPVSVAHRANPSALRSMC